MGVSQSMTDTVSLAVTTAVFYEYLLTFIQEVRQYWNRGINIPIALFLANRYFCLIHRLFLLVVVFVRPYPDILRCFLSCRQRCPVLLWCSEIYAVVAFVLTTFLSAARVYALWRSLLPPFLVSAFGLVAPATSIVFMKLSGDTLHPYTTSCGSSLLAGTNAYNLFYVARASSVIQDILVALFTWMKMHHLTVNAREVGFIARLPRVLIRTGIYYFAAVAAFNVYLLLLTKTSDVVINTSNLAALAAILMSRFMLRLRQAVHSEGDLMGNLCEWMDDESDAGDDEDITFANGGSTPVQSAAQ